MNDSFELREETYFLRFSMKTGRTSCPSDVFEMNDAVVCRRYVSSIGAPLTFTLTSTLKFTRVQFSFGILCRDTLTSRLSDSLNTSTCPLSSAFAAVPGQIQSESMQNSNAPFIIPPPTPLLYVPVGFGLWEVTPCWKHAGRGLEPSPLNTSHHHHTSLTFRPITLPSVCLIYTEISTNIPGRTSTTWPAIYQTKTTICNQHRVTLKAQPWDWKLVVRKSEMVSVALLDPYISDH